MPLVSIADLARPPEELAPLRQQARGLSELWNAFVLQDGEAYSYTVSKQGESSRGGGIHASEMSECMLRLVYSILGIERRHIKEVNDYNMKMRFKAGDALHAMVQSDFARMSDWYTREHRDQGLALSFESEVRITPEFYAVAQEWGINSGCDGVFTFWHWDGTQWVAYLRVGVEIKSSSALEYEKRKGPEGKHAKQACLYQKCLDLPLMWTIYYNKSNSNYTTPTMPWLFDFDEKLWEEELEMRFRTAYEHVRTQQMPPRNEGHHCRFCPFTHHCGPEVLKRVQPQKGISAGLRVLP
jgi:CRISPR/Cas system-associated exonuclease Cas4 (RecB family)